MSPTATLSRLTEFGYRVVATTTVQRDTSIHTLVWTLQLKDIWKAICVKDAARGGGARKFPLLKMLKCKKILWKFKFFGPNFKFFAPIGTAGECFLDSIIFIRKVYCFANFSLLKFPPLKIFDSPPEIFFWLSPWFVCMKIFVNLY